MIPSSAISVSGPPYEKSEPALRPVRIARALAVWLDANAPELNAGARLARAGLARVERLAADTCAEPDRFFSYRRACRNGEQAYGRLLSAISLEP